MKTMDKIKSFSVVAGLLFALSFPCQAQTSGVIAMAPGQSSTLQLLSVLVANQASATAPTVTASYQSNYVPFGALTLSSTYAGSLVAGQPGTITFTVKNTLPASTAASNVAFNVLGEYTDNTGKAVGSGSIAPTTGVLTLASTAAVNNTYTGINFSIIIPATEFVPSPPVAGANYSYVAGSVVLVIPSLDGGATFTAVVPGVYE